jgi:ATP-binding cassette subfamily F protein uup
MLAKLFTLPSNVLVLDEPTNDLDAESLDLLEDMLVNYGGTVLLVSHDRAFLNNVVTSTIVLEGEGKVGEYIGGYDDWVRQRKEEEQPTSSRTEKSNRTRPVQSGPRKLTFNEKRDLETLPARIEAWEKEKKELYDSLSTPEVYEREGGVAEVNARIEELEKELADAYERWTDLEDRSIR